MGIAVTDIIQDIHFVIRIMLKDTRKTLTYLIKNVTSARKCFKLTTTKSIWNILN